MKFLHFILAFYMTALSVYPCYEDNCEGEVCIVNGVEVSADHEQEGPDLCTPFCTSACCYVQVLSTTNINIKPGFQNSEVQNSTYTNKFTPQVTISIWQPPKLA